MKTLVNIILSLILIFVFGSNIFADSDETNIYKFTLKNLQNEDVRLSDFKYKLVLINFWATWCAPCLKEMPDLVKLKKDFIDKEFEILGIAVAANEKSVKKIVDNYKINYPVLWGTTEIVTEFGNISSIPRSFLINQDGEIVEDILGMRDYEFFKKLVDKYIKK